jgi:hypothetical protein
MSVVVSSLMPDSLRSSDRTKTGGAGDELVPRRFALAGARRASEAHPNDRTERIRRRAYELYLARGAVDGYDVADWLEAERQIDAGR